MSNPKTKLCWIVQDKHGIVMSIVTPKWISGNFPQKYEAHIDSVSPQLRKMWKKALKGKRGKNAIVECDWQTWRPIMRKECCTLHFEHTHTDDCFRCHGTGIEEWLMDEGDL